MPTSFTPNCTLPPPDTNYVSTPPVRGTLDILWSCLSIFVLCTWSIHHPPVPIQACPQNTKQRLWKQWHIFRRKLVFAINMLFIPEWVLAMTATEFQSALESTRHAKKHGEDLTMADGFYLDMGGFAIVFPDETSAASSIQPALADVELRNLVPEQSSPPVSIDPGHISQGDSDTQREHTTISSFDQAIDEIPDREQLRSLHGLGGHRSPRIILESQTIDTFLHYVAPDKAQKGHRQESERMGPTGWTRSPQNMDLIKNAWAQKVQDKPPDDVIDGWKRNLSLLQGNFWVLNARQFRYAKTRGIVCALPRLSPEDLDDRNQSNLFIKGLAVIQVIWLIIQMSARAYYALPSSQLEVLALAYATSALVVYVLLWEKPQDVRFMGRVVAERFAEGVEVYRLAELGPDYFGPSRKSVWVSSTSSNSGDFHLEVLYSVLGAIVFGSVHLLAWNFTFPTPVERLSWRVCSSLTIGLPFLILLTMATLVTIDEKVVVSNLLFQLLPSGLILIYVLARLFIMVEVFRSLGYLPPDAFRATWATNVPHIG